MGRLFAGGAGLGCLLLLHVLVQQVLPAQCQGPKLNEQITYKNYYPNEKMQPNSCKIVHNAAATGNSSINLNGTAGYVPFIGTSLGRDPQQLVLRLYYSMRDYPVKYFIVVIPERSLSPPHGAVWYEVQHLKQHADNAVIIACTRTSSVAEGWNAVFQAFPGEAWGIYAARDTAWMPGSLQKLAGHMWKASQDNSVEVALMSWTWPIGLGLYNSFGFTRAALNRFGLFDENIYPAYYEDNDFQLRQHRMQPPMSVKVLPDVVMMHGKPSENSYSSGVHTADDPNDSYREGAMRTFWQVRAHINRAYVLRKWGCAGASWDTCAYKTPFNKSLPVWYWYTSKHQRTLDYERVVKDGKLVDGGGDGDVLDTLPKDFIYTGWAGYNKSAHTCRVTGPVGVVARNASGLWCV